MTIKTENRPTSNETARVRSGGPQPRIPDDKTLIEKRPDQTIERLMKSAKGYGVNINLELPDVLRHPPEMEDLSGGRKGSLLMSPPIKINLATFESPIPDRLDGGHI